MHLFIATHLGSGASMLCDSLSKQSYIVRSHPRFHYLHFSDLPKMLPHARILYDKLVFNYQLATPVLYRSCKFIYIVREPEYTLGHLIEDKGYSPKGAYNYYCFRLRRLCEMIIKTDSLLLTWDDLVSGKAIESVKSYLGLKNLSDISYEPEEKYSYQSKSAHDTFEKYLAYMRLNSM